jgi:hypothetical protein
MMNMTQTIEVDYGNGTFHTTPFQLLQWKHALKLEKVGMTMSRGRKVSTHMRKLMGLKRTYPIDDLIEWTESTLEAITQAMKGEAA